MKKLLIFVCLLFFVLPSYASASREKEILHYLPKDAKIANLQENLNVKITPVFYKNLTNDKNQDIIVAFLEKASVNSPNWANRAKIAVFKVQGKELIKVWQSDGLGYRFDYFKVTDINRDGRLEIVVIGRIGSTAGCLLTIYSWDKEKGSFTKLTYPWQVAYSFKLEDLDKNGGLEVATANSYLAKISAPPDIYRWTKDKYTLANHFYPNYYKTQIKLYEDCLKDKKLDANEKLIVSYYLVQVYERANYNLPKAAQLTETLLAQVEKQGTLYPKTKDLYLVLGHIYLKQGKYNKALTQFQKVTQPSYADNKLLASGHYGTALAYKNLKQKQLCNRHLKYALTYDPFGEAATLSWKLKK